MYSNYQYNEDDAIEKNYNNLYEMLLDVANEQDWFDCVERLEEIYERPYKMIGEYSWDDIVDAVDPDACILLHNIEKEDVIADLWEQYEYYCSEQYEKELLRTYYIERDDRSYK